MSTEPPNQSQLGLVTGLWSLPFSKKQGKGHEEAGDEEETQRERRGEEKRGKCVRAVLLTSSPNKKSVAIVAMLTSWAV